MVFDIVGGLVVIGVAATILIGVSAQVMRATGELADQRHATQAAESVLTQLQTCQPAPVHDPDATVTVTRLSCAAPAGHYQWVEARATVNSQTRSLIGLVPSNGALGPPTTRPATTPSGENP
jgi:type II secretory pathway pseudopilin PulG